MNLRAYFGDSSRTIGPIDNLKDLDDAFKRIKKRAKEEGLE